VKVFISADIEGIGGVTTWDQAATDRPDHPRARQWMTEDVNAAIEGALQGGATEVLVRDAHGRARNILWESLHPRARLVSGWGPTPDMLLGIDGSFGLLLLIGYHPGPSVPQGVLSHTFTSRILDVRLNDQPCNEAVIAALAAGIHGVPVGMVSGQAELLCEIRPTLPDCTFVATKRGLAYQAAVLEPLAEVRGQIREGARAAVTRALNGNAPTPFQPAPPLRFELELATVEAAEALEGIEGIERISAGGCLLNAPDAALLLQRFFAALKILYAVKDSP